MTTKLRRIFFVLCLVGLGLVYPAPEAFACSCAGPLPDRAALRHTDAVFAGRVVDTTGPLFSGRSSNGYAIAVETAYKGTVHERQWVFSEQEETACGIHLSWGKRYLVFAHGDDAKRLFTNSCSNTHVLDDEPKLEVAGTVVAGASRSSPPDIFWALLTIAAGVFAFRLGKKHHSSSSVSSVGAGE